MAGIVLGGVCRFTCHGDYFGRNWANVVDMDIDTAAGESRTAAIEDQAKVLIQQWSLLVQVSQSNQSFFRKVSWVDFDTANGVVGEETQGHGGVSLPEAGNQLTVPGPGNVAVLVRKVVTGGRQARHGRWFLPGNSEAVYSGNSLDSSALTTLQANLNTFLDALNQENTPIIGTSQYSSRLVVVHQAAGTPASFSPVTSLQAQSLLATQRRRLRA